MQILEINKEILMEKDTLFMGLTVRETVFAALGVSVTAGGSMLVQSTALGMQGGSWIAILAGMPLFALGFWKKNGMPLEKYLGAVMRSKFSAPQKRPVRYPNIHYDLLIKEKEEENGENTLSPKRYLLRGSKNGKK